MELHNALSTIDVTFYQDNDVLWCPNNQFDLCWQKIRYTVNRYSIEYFQIISDEIQNLVYFKIHKCVASHTQIRKQAKERPNAEGLPGSINKWGSDNLYRVNNSSLNHVHVLRCIIYRGAILKCDSWTTWERATIELVKGVLMQPLQVRTKNNTEPMQALNVQSECGLWTSNASKTTPYLWQHHNQCQDWSVLIAFPPRQLPPHQHLML